jgi:hypothetical protein
MYRLGLVLILVVVVGPAAADPTPALTAAYVDCMNYRNTQMAGIRTARLPTYQTGHESCVTTEAQYRAALPAPIMPSTTKAPEKK